MAERIRYRKIEEHGRTRRVRVITFDGIEGYEIRYTSYCTGCTEHGDYGSLLLGKRTEKGTMGIGCHECGYKGVRRRTDWLPFDADEFFAATRDKSTLLSDRSLSVEAPK